MSDKNESKAVGGKARAKALSPAERSAIAKAAANTRWGLTVTHKGNFLDAFGIDVDCYVLNDLKKTAVISQRGMAEILLNADSGGSALPRFAKGQTVSKALGAEILEKIDNPLIFKGDHVGAAAQFQGQINGYEVGLLIDICQALIMADGRSELLPRYRYERIVNQARIILGASAKAGIQGLVYALAGYDRTKEDVIEAYKLYVREEAREYEKEFSPELYEQWYRLYGLTKPERGRPWEFKYLTIDHIYKPLARSQGKVFDLAKASKQENGEKGSKVHMFLSEIGVKALRTQIGKIIGIATVSDSRAEYEKYIAEKIYGQQSLDLRE
ncbi:P63C domain-containing protein [Streptomyces albidoflavus]|uniref:P63C domain-containing protein n=1 Tax=Streptomyces albidoflavus TaxID=1886 RepID=UPI00341E9402